MKNTEKHLDEYPKNPYEVLAHEIILSAVRDYRKALKKLKKDSECERALSTKRACERFFRSSWYRVLTNLDCEIIIKGIQKEIGVITNE